MRWLLRGDSMGKRLKCLSVMAVFYIILFSGCIKQDEPKPQGPASQPLIGESQQVSSNEPAVHQFITSSSTIVPTRWSDDSSSFVIQENRSLVYLDSNTGKVTKTVFFDIPGEDNGVDMPIFSWNDDMVFITGCNNAPARVVMKNGKPSFVNAAVYSAAGKLIRMFPEMPYDEVNSLIEKYERSVPQNFCEVTWLDNDRFAVNTRARIYIYTVSTDTLALVSDMADYVRKGWTIYASNSFGASPGWMYKGIYYYPACLEVVNNQQRELLYKVNKDNSIQLVFQPDELPASPYYQCNNGVLFVFENCWDNEKQQNYCRVSYADLNNEILRQFTNLMNYYYAYHFNNLLFFTDCNIDSNGYFDYFLTYFNMQTGEFTTIKPNQFDLPKPKGKYGFNLLSIDGSGSDDPHLIFVVSDGWEDNAITYCDYCIYSYGLSSHELKLVTRLPKYLVVDNISFPNAVSPDGLHSCANWMNRDNDR